MTIITYITAQDSRKKFHLTTDNYGKCAWSHAVCIHVIIIHWSKLIHLNRPAFAWYMLTVRGSGLILSHYEQQFALIQRQLWGKG